MRIAGRTRVARHARLDRMAGAGAWRMGCLPYARPCSAGG